MIKSAIIDNHLYQLVKTEILRNSFTQYAITAGLILGLILVILVARVLVKKRFLIWLGKREHVRLRMKYTHALVRSFFKVLLVLPWYVGLHTLKFSPNVTQGISIILMIILTLRGLTFISRLLAMLLDSMWRHTDDYMGTKAITPIITVVVWAIGISFLLDNLGLKITSIMAGLGIMGVAVGLAGQFILADFFGYLVILLDRPFKIGDTVTIGGVTGVVESVGFRTTRLRSATGEIIYYPNGDLTKKSINNYRPIDLRGRTFQFGVTYETPLDKVKAIPYMVADVIQAIPDTELVRVHFINFADSSLLFEVMFRTRTNNLSVVLDAQHKINIALMERFAMEGIEFAYPTQVVHLASDSVQVSS